jgi:(R,R)-butanediol dehydrogenase/meso-butanediol dehydrogenase/diacetyl reductase
MKEAQFLGKGEIKVVEVAEPQNKAGEVIIEIGWCGICGSDLHEYIMGLYYIEIIKATSD